MAVADLTYTYREPSVVRQRADGTQLLLATSGGVTETGPVLHPYFFSGFLTEPDVAATGMLACAAVARSRYFLPARRGSSRIIATTRQLQAAASSDAPDRSRAAAQALTALVTGAEAAAGR